MSDRAISGEEEPSKPRSQFAVAALCFYDSGIVKCAHTIKPSARRELEIATVNNTYLNSGTLNAELLGRGFACVGTGTHDSLMEASSFVQAIEKRHGFRIACLKEIGFRGRWLGAEEQHALASERGKSCYGDCLTQIAEGS